MEELLSFGQVFCEDDFNEKVRDLNNKISVSRTPSPYSMSGDPYLLSNSGKVTLVESEYELTKGIKLDPEKGREVLLKNKVLAYDESIDKYPSLEGDCFLTCHSIVYVTPKDYLSKSYLTFGFYTQSEKLIKQVHSAMSIKDILREAGSSGLVEDPEKSKSEVASKHVYAVNRSKFILESALEGSVILIDGPLIGAQISHYNIEMAEKLMEEKKAFPIFIVKNSNSNLVVDNINGMHNQYNSDMHWAYVTLNPGERSPFFLYQDQVVSNNEKIFCYIRPFNKASPQRIEFPPDIYYDYMDDINNLMDMIYYLYLDQGDADNVQVRPIIIAEMYAREIKKMYNLRRIMARTNLQPTMNKQRGMV